MIQRLYNWLRDRLRWVNIGLAGAAYLANLLLLQVFCQPVAWAAAVLVGFLVAFLGWPWLQKTGRLPQYIALFVQGVGLLVCAYCSWFLGLSSYVISLLTASLLIPLLAWVPVFFAAQIVRRAWRTPLPRARATVAAGLMTALPVLVWGEWEYQQVAQSVSQVPPRRPAALASRLPHSYMAERLVGIGFRYHLLAEYIYDGWRPPLHDPLVNVLVRWHGRIPIPFTSLNEQVAVYRQMFPGRPVKAECVCADTYDGRSYRRWRPGIDNWGPPDGALHR